ncbi:MAG TPA: 3-(cis-5,6-dihydroxycyclohexa-1,3-dien-1-yl)propanoate dehydrogenase [Mycobacterium sp.]|jgi:NAD(P)-dependent dehydrogenase (short-subunit alcohol dehydrogenase family)|nr:3-(cis-5,6-dihydroxycyclohexa-1,3-dien-1-yl)propanoate dehydrogenase [Mycobacterium sp.]
MSSLRNRVVAVTGGAAGIGLAVVERFLAEGARVAVMDRSEGNIAQLRKKHPEVCALVGDVTEYEDNRRLVARASDDFGGLDVFIGNAGIFDYFTPLVGFEPEALGRAFDEIFAVNVKAYLLGAHAAVPELLKSDAPTIIFTASSASFYTAGGGPLYTASKHAVVGVVRQLAYELAPKIRVNGVAPGGTVTGLRGIEQLGQGDKELETVPDIWQLMRSTNPLLTAQRPEDHCGLYALLASSGDCRAVTGVVINSDGGMGVRGLTTPAGGTGLTA